MNVIVVGMVVAMALSSTLQYSEAIDGDFTSEEVCEQIRSNKRRILTMGARGTSLHDAHFYILTVGGYMFKVPLSNVHLNAAKNTTSITIDREYIQADELLNVDARLFTSQDQFFLISNQNKDSFLGRMYLCKEFNEGAIQLYNLKSKSAPVQSPSYLPLEEYNRIQVLSSLGVNLGTTYAFAMNGSNLVRLYGFEMNDQDGLTSQDAKYITNLWYMMDFERATPIVAVFLHQEDIRGLAGYYYFLDADGLVTVTRRKNASDWVYNSMLGRSISALYTARFDVNLSSFIVCPKVVAPPTVSNESAMQKTNETDETDEHETDEPEISKWTIFLVVVVVAIVLLAIILYCTHLTIEAKQAKAVAKGKNSKVEPKKAKSKVHKSPKFENSPRESSTRLEFLTAQGSALKGPSTASGTATANRSSQAKSSDLKFLTAQVNSATRSSTELELASAQGSCLKGSTTGSGLSLDQGSSSMGSSILKKPSFGGTTLSAAFGSTPSSSPLNVNSKASAKQKLTKVQDRSPKGSSISPTLSITKKSSRLKGSSITSVKASSEVQDKVGSPKKSSLSTNVGTTRTSPTNAKSKAKRTLATKKQSMGKWIAGLLWAKEKKRKKNTRNKDKRKDLMKDSDKK